MADLDKQLSDLFTQLVKVMQEKLNSPDVDAATLGQIRQLLKDNGVESRPQAGQGNLLKLAQSLPFEADESAAA
jgi:hypothetical protein